MCLIVDSTVLELHVFILRYGWDQTLVVQWNYSISAYRILIFEIDFCSLRMKNSMANHRYNGLVCLKWLHCTYTVYFFFQRNFHAADPFDEQTHMHMVYSVFVRLIFDTEKNKIKNKMKSFTYSICKSRYSMTVTHFSTCKFLLIIKIYV